jgi:hypothetical protein
VPQAISCALHGIPDAMAAQAWGYLPKDVQTVIQAL